MSVSRLRVFTGVVKGKLMGQFQEELAKSRFLPIAFCTVWGGTSIGVMAFLLGSGWAGDDRAASAMFGGWGGICGGSAGLIAGAIASLQKP